MPPSAEKQLPRVPLAILAFCWLLLCGSFLVPEIPQHQKFAEGAVYVARYGGTSLAPVIGAAVALLLVTRADLTWKHRLLELIVLSAVLTAVLWGGSWLNNNLVSPLLGVHRPNVIGMDEERSLGISLEALDGMDSDQERSDWLKQILENKYFEGIQLSEPVRNYWIAEAGSSLPAGYVIGAFLTLTLGLVSTWSLTSTWRFAVVCLLLPGTIAICYADVLLRMHWPNDLIVSAMAGILLGIGVFKLLQKTLWKSRFETTSQVEVEPTSTTA